MKKRTQLIMILSALLSLAMLFASCSSGTEAEKETTSNTETTQATETSEETEVETEETVEVPEPTPSDEVVDYTSIINKWFEHLNFTAPSLEAGLQSTSLFTTGVDDQTGYGGNRVERTATVGGKLGVYKVVTDSKALNAAYEYKDARSIKYSIYNMETGAVIKELTAPGYFVENAGTQDYYEVALLRNVVNNNYLGIAKITYAVYNANKLDAAGLPAPGYVYTYTYINTKGEVMYTGTEDTTWEVVSTEGSISVVELNGKLYACTNNDIFYEFAEGENLRHLAYLPTEYNGYRYYFNGNKVQVANDKYELVADIDVNATVSNVTFDILGSGNVLVRGSVLVYDEDADYESSNAYTAVLDVTTGELKEIETDFVIKSVITNYNTEKGISLKNSAHMYAEITKFADGKLASETEAVILDENLAVVATLPNFVKNQLGVVNVLKNGNLVVKAQTIGDTLYYSVDIDNDDAAKVTLYADVQVSEDIVGGFVTNGVIYNDYMGKLKDVNGDFYDYYVTPYGTVILYSRTYDDVNGTYNHSTSVAYITEYNTVYTTNIANFEVSNPYGTANYYVGEYGIYNIYGTQILSKYETQTLSVVKLSDTCMYARVTSDTGTQAYYIIK